MRSAYVGSHAATVFSMPTCRNAAKAKMARRLSAVFDDAISRRWPDGFGLVAKHEAARHCCNGRGNGEQDVGGAIIVPHKDACSDERAQQERRCSS